MRPIWKSMKFSFQTFLFVIFLTTIATTNAGAIRYKRETSDTENSHATTSIKIATETTVIDVNSTKLNQSTTSESPIIAITPSSTAVGISTLNEIPSPTIPLAQSQQLLEVNDDQTTVKYADVRNATIAGTLIDIASDSMPTITISPLPSVVVVTTPAYKFDVVTSATSGSIREEQLTTVQNDETEDNITSDAMDENTVITTTTLESPINSSSSSSPSRHTFTIDETTTSEPIGKGTSNKTLENVRSITKEHQDQLFKINITTTPIHINADNFDYDSTTPDLMKSDHDEITNSTTTETNLTTTLEISELESTNYDIATNEIKNSTIDDHLPVNNDSEKRSKHIRGNEASTMIPNAAEVLGIANMRNFNHTKMKEGHVGNATTATTSFEKLKTKGSTVATKQLADWTEIMKIVDINNANNNSHSFTSSASNSIENTLETGKIDDPVTNKITKQQLIEESKIMPQIVDIPVVNGTSHSIHTTPSFNDILIASTPSIERNKVEDVEDITPQLDNKKSLKVGPVFREKLIANTTTSTITEINNSVPTATISINGHKTEEPIDTTTKRMERSTTIPVETGATVKETVAFTVNEIPLTTIHSEIEYESTTTNDYLISERGITEGKSTTTETLLPESTTLSETTFYTVASDSTTEEISPIPLITSTERLETIRLATTVPSTTPMQPTSTNPSSTTRIGIEEATSTINTSQKTSTSTSDEQYNFKQRANRTKESTDEHESGKNLNLSTTATTELQTGATASYEPHETDYNVIIAIVVSIVGIIALILLVGFLYVMRKRQKSISYGQRCRPVSLDAYSLDNVSVFNSVRRKGILRSSKRSYGNAAFDDPSLKHNAISIHELARFVDRRINIYDEFKDVPQITARADEVPPGCEDKNRYANVIPLPETRVILKQLNNDVNTEYINANYVRGPKDPQNYYIACQAPLESTVADFWRMIWEQNSRVIIMATDLTENGIEKCAEYLPPSITLDNHIVYGEFQITLKNRDVKDTYAVSTLHVKNITMNHWREITHFWYQWPDAGVPNDEAGVIAMLLEARSCLKMGTPEQTDDDIEKQTDNSNDSTESIVDKTKSLTKTQGPLTVHCSPGTGRTGTIISCDIALRSLETPKRILDIPQIVYYVRRGRASAVQTKEQYEFIYKVAHMYATKISGPINDN